MVNYNALYAKYLMDRYGVAWFKFDETVTSTVFDSKGSNTSTVTGTSIVSGVSGNARSFNGASLIQLNSRVIPLGRKSIRFKFKRNGNPLSDEYIISNELGSSGSHGDRISVTANTGLMTWVSCRGTAGSFRLAFSSTNSVCDNQWHDILLTWDGTINSNAAKIYVDDMVTPVAIATATAIETVTQSANLVIGASSLTNARLFFTGQLDEFEVYNEVIDPIMSKILLSSGDKYYSTTQPLLKENPPMTSNTAPSGLASASTSYDVSTGPYYAFRRIPTGQGWRTNNLKSGWLQYDFGSGKEIAVNSYTISLTYFDSIPAGSPKNWTFEGSNTGSFSGDQKILDSKANYHFTEITTVFTIKNKESFRYYRLNISENNGGTWLYISDLILQELPLRKLVEKDDLDENTYLSSEPDNFQLNKLFEETISVTTKINTLGLGKTFEHTIDMSKRRVDKITLG